VWLETRILSHAACILWHTLRRDSMDPLCRASSHALYESRRVRIAAFFGVLAHSDVFRGKSVSLSASTQCESRYAVRGW
jgi:hypothetical protein